MYRLHLLLISAVVLLISISTMACAPGAGIQTGDPSRGIDTGVGPGTGSGPGHVDGGPVSLGCSSDADCTAPLFCDQGTKQCALEGQCGTMSMQASGTPPNLLIVLDRSCSMKATAGWGGPRKWDTAVAAITKLVTDQKDKIRFGLTLFPDRTGSSCSQDDFPVPVGASNEDKIKQLLKDAMTWGDTYYPNGPCVTNIDSAMEQASKDPSLADPSRRSFVLLLTDGKQFGCSAAGGDTGTTKIIQGLAQKKVATFVVGFGSGIDAPQLNAFAQAGGKPTGSAQQFYKAEDQATLDAALAAIANTALGCQYTLSDPPDTLQQLLVFFDNKLIGQDKTHQQGWDYDPSTGQVTLYGPSCSALQEGQVQRLDILLSCQAQAPDAGAQCKPGVTPCAQQSDCPGDTQVCVAGCCVKVVE